MADGKTANRQILEDLNNGASGLSLVLQGSAGDYGHALPPSEAVLKEALEDVHFEWGVPIELQLGPLCKDAALMLANLVQQRGLAPSDVNIRFGFDPIGVLAANGWNNVVWPDMANVFASLVGEMIAQGFKGPFAVGDGRPVHAAGGSEAQELAFALSTALAYVRAAHDGGVPSIRRGVSSSSVWRRTRTSSSPPPSSAASASYGRASKRHAVSSRSRPSSPPRPPGA
nr:methylmalonyl-CoA mutase family protein [Methyloceanibacter marginalis]